MRWWNGEEMGQSLLWYSVLVTMTELLSYAYLFPKPLAKFGRMMLFTITLGIPMNCTKSKAGLYIYVFKGTLPWRKKSTNGQQV